MKKILLVALFGTFGNFFSQVYADTLYTSPYFYCEKLGGTINKKMIFTPSAQDASKGTIQFDQVPCSQPLSSHLASGTYHHKSSTEVDINFPDNPTWNATLNGNKLSISNSDLIHPTPEVYEANQ